MTQITGPIVMIPLVLLVFVPVASSRAFPGSSFASSP
jgi:hypothetical protein